MEGSFFSVISEPAEDKSPEVHDEEHMLPMVNHDQEREDVSTTVSDGDVNPRWLKICKKRSKQKTEAQETLDVSAVRNIDEENEIH